MSLDDYVISTNVEFCWTFRLLQVISFTSVLLTARQRNPYASVIMKEIYSGNSVITN